MKNKVLSTVAVLALGATMAFAAPHDGKGGWEGHHGKGGFGREFAQKLNLTDAQKTQMKDLMKNFRETNKAFFDSVNWRSRMRFSLSSTSLLTSHSAPISLGVPPMSWK